MKALITVVLLTATVSFAETEKLVAFKTSDGHYLTATVKGGLDTSSTTITNRQVFYLINVGEDKVQIRYGKDNPDANFKASFLRESENGLSRERKATAASTFKLIRKDKTVLLQTASGKYVAAGKPLTLTDATEKALVLEIVEPPAQ